MTVEPVRDDIAPIQMLRGIAATMVVFVHIALQVRRLGFTAIDAEWMLSGVDIFFVISGFIMWVSLARHPQRTAREFMLHRIVRVVPLYWLLTALMVVVMLVAPQLLQSARFDLPHIIKSFLFIPAPHPLTGAYWPVLVPGWTLNFEMFFYLLFSAAIVLSKGVERTRLLIIAALIIAAVVIANVADVLPDAVRHYGDSIILEFLFGIAVGWAYVRGWPIRSAVAWVLIAIGFALLFVLHASENFPRVLIAGLPAMLVVTGAAFVHRLSIPPLTLLGDASYSLYLSHVFTLSAVTQAWRSLHLARFGEALFLVVAPVAAILVALLFYRFVERPMTRAAARMFQARRERQPRALPV